MDTGIIFALVLAALFIGGIIWLVVYSNRQRPQRNSEKLSIKLPEGAFPIRRGLDTDTARSRKITIG